MKDRPFFFIFFLLFPLLGYMQKVESLHSVKFGIPSVTYSYEQALGKRVTINMEAGVTWGWQSYNNSTEILISPIFQVEPRFYYNVKKRYEQGHSLNNSASFFSLNSGIILDTDSRSHSLFIVPKWGFRRALGEHIIFETQFGGGLWFGTNSHRFNPALDLKFGYVF